MANPSLLKYNSLAIARISGEHRLCRCSCCLLEANEVEDIEEREENWDNLLEEIESFLSIARLLEAAKEPTVETVLKDDAMSC